MAHTKQADGGRLFHDSLPALRVPAFGVNVSTLERIASALAGSALAAWGLSRRGPAGRIRHLLGLPYNEDALLLPADVVRQIKEDPSSC